MLKCSCSEEHVLRISKAGDIPVELLGAWTTMIGPAQDQAGTEKHLLLCVCVCVEYIIICVCVCVFCSPHLAL